jgi:tRNA dimethylallyltransferase
MTNREAILIFGPTSSGKSETAKQIANKIKCVIINADSLQVYKELRILTSRPSIDDEKLFLHRMYGHVSGNIQYTVADWLKEISKEINRAFEQNLTPVIVGGTGLYFKSLIEGLAVIPDIKVDRIKLTQEELKNNGMSYLFNEILKHNPKSLINKNDSNRIIRAYNVLKQTGKSIEDWQNYTSSPILDISYRKLLVNPTREMLYKNAEDRFDQMLKHGAIDEVENLKRQNYAVDTTIMKAIGVREISEYIEGYLTKNEAISLAKQKTRNYIKRQQTWINSNNITWNDSFEKLMTSL